MQTFETYLKSNVATMPPSFNKRRLQHILSLPADSWRRQHALLRMEQEARTDLNIDDNTEVDWKEGATAGSGTINWTNLLQLLAKLLPIILAFFGA